METCTSNINLPQEPQNAVMQNQEEDDFPLSDPDPPKRHPFQCDVCDRILTTKQSLQFHKRTHEDLDIRKMFRCEICDATFKSRNGLSYHLETKHTAGCERPKLPCPTCGRIFKSEEGRKIHLTIQHGAGGPVFKCKECPMVFARKNHLDLHMTTHGTGLHVCTTCGKSYARLKDLSRHEEYCGVKELCCPVCGKQLRTEQALENHRKKCRSGGWKMEPGVGEKRGRPRKSYSGCEQGKVRMRRSKYDLFIGLDHLADPSALAEEEKPVKIELKPADPYPKRFPCEHCSLNFASKQAMQYHAQRRHWEILGFTKPAVLKRGRKRKHPLEQVPKKIGRPRKKVNNVEQLPEVVEHDTAEEEVDPVKLEKAAYVEPEIVVIPEAVGEKLEPGQNVEDPLSGNLAAEEDIMQSEIGFSDNEYNHGEPTIGEPVKNVFIPEEKNAPIEPVEESDIFATNELIIKDEIHELGEYGFNYSEDEWTDNNDDGDVAKFTNIPDLEMPQGPTKAEVNALDVAPALETNVSEQPQIKKLVIRLQKLDYSALVKASSNKQETPKTEPMLEVNLKLHSEKVNGITDQRNNRSCKHCGRNYQHLPGLLKHLKRIHGETIDESQCVQCPSCRTRFLTDEEMKEHRCSRKVTALSSFKCDRCNKVYPSLVRLECHYPVHTEYQNFRCDQCPKAYFKESGLQNHKDYKHGSRVPKIQPFKPRGKNPYPRVECEHCGQTYAHQYYLACHRVKEHGSTETPVRHRTIPNTSFPRNFHCDQCDKAFYREVNLATHKAKVHGVGEAPLKSRINRFLLHSCKHCKKEMTTFKSLLYHRKFIHGENIDKTQFAQCPSCRFKFINEEEMAGHLCLKGVVVPGLERAFKCDLCDKTYVEKIHLEIHYTVHPEYHKFKCDQCSRGFFVQRELNIHMKKVHVPKDLYYRCETCNQLLKTRHSLKRHQETHMNREYCCEHCGKKFNMRTNLKSHILNMHDAARAARAISCTICGKTLKDKNNLRVHMRKHNIGSRRHKCPFPSCGKTFFTRVNLDEHVQSHTKDYKFKCKFCDYGSVKRQNLQLHELRKHNHNRFAEVNDT